MLVKRALEEMAKGTQQQQQQQQQAHHIGAATAFAPLPVPTAAAATGSLPSLLPEDLLRAIERQVAEHYPRRTVLLGLAGNNQDGSLSRRKRNSSQVNCHLFENV